MASANEALQSRAIEHALLLVGFSKGTADKIGRLTNRVDLAILEKLAGRLTTIVAAGAPAGKKRNDSVAALMAEIAKMSGGLSREIYAIMEADLSRFAGLEADFQKASLETALTVDIGVKQLSAARLKAIVTETPITGTFLKDWISDIDAGRVADIQRSIQSGLFEQQSVEQMVQKIRGTKAAGFTDGILSISRRKTQSMVLTSISHVSNVAAQETWKANGKVVKAWQFLATLDDRVTTQCAGLSGSTYPIGEGPIPPRHPRCRSVSVPVLKSFRELGIDKDEVPEGTRASMDGQVAASTTMAQFLRSKGEATQNKVLGKTRARLFREGRLELRKFLDDTGELLTLDQLEKRYSDLFR